MTKLLCPHCGSPVADYDSIDLRRLTRLQSRALEALVSGRNRFLAANSLIDQIYADDPNGGPLDSQACLRSVIHKLRPKLRKTGWDIELRWGVGYRLIKLEGQAGAQ